MCSWTSPLLWIHESLYFFRILQERFILMLRYIFFLFIYAISTNIVLGQIFVPRTFDVVGHQGQVLQNPFSGGMDRPQFSEADMNNDGLLDMYVYDYTGKISEVYLNGGGEWIYAPDYAKVFPELSYTVFLRDYDGDGAADLFAHSGSSGYLVYKGSFDNDTLRFQQLFLDSIDPYLRYEDSMGNVANIEMQPELYPSIADADDDGDLDIISIDQNTGYLEYYQNVSVESGFGLDSLHFIKDNDCFGGVLEDGTGRTLLLSNVPNVCASLRMSQGQSNIHGGYSLLLLDKDGDGDNDLLFGDKSYSSMNMLTNGGDNTNYHFTSQDTLYPSYDVSIDANTIPVAFYLDTDFDDVKDIVVSSRIAPFIYDSYSFNYKNFGTATSPDFRLEEEDWLGVSAIDYGKISNITFTDYNQDGLQDMVLSSQDIRLNPDSTNAVLFLFENVGTQNNPSFSFVESDWLGLRFLNSLWLSPIFEDLDDDGDNDLLLGHEDGTLVFLENMAGVGQPYNFDTPILNYKNIDVGFLASPQFIDLDEDGLKDLAIGMRQGNIVFFKNIGVSGNPDFDSDANSATNDFQLGDIFFGPTGLPSPRFVEEAGELILYVGVEDGQILKYGNIRGNLSGAFTLMDATWNSIDVGDYATPTFIDIDRNGYLDVFVGNFRGGLNTWSTSIYVGNEITPNQEVSVMNHLKVYPNPVKDKLFYDIHEEVIKTTIYDAMGRKVNHGSKDVSSLSKGVYILEIHTHQRIYTSRFIKE